MSQASLCSNSLLGQQAKAELVQESQRPREAHPHPIPQKEQGSILGLSPALVH